MGKDKMSAHTCKCLFHRAHHDHPGTRLHPARNEQLLTGSEIIDKERRAEFRVIRRVSMVWRQGQLYL